MTLQAERPYWALEMYDNFDKVILILISIRYNWGPFLSAPSDILFYQHRATNVKINNMVGKRQEMKYIIRKRAVAQQMCWTSMQMNVSFIHDTN